jgi:hypothetical protein
MKKAIIISVVSVVVILILVWIFLWLHKMNKFTKSWNIVSFEYWTSNWWTFSDTYKLYKSGDNVIFEKSSFDDWYDETKQPDIKVMDPDILDKLTKLVFDYKVNRRDGFHKTNRHVLDWTSWHLYINFENWDHLSADGYMRHPRKYHEAIDAIMNFIAIADVSK